VDAARCGIRRIASLVVMAARDGAGFLVMNGRRSAQQPDALRRLSRFTGTVAAACVCQAAVHAGVTEDRLAARWSGLRDPRLNKRWSTRRAHMQWAQQSDRLAAGEQWQDTGLVFTTALGCKMDAANVRRDFRRALALVSSLDPLKWTPRELRHSFVSVLSDAGVPVEQISQLVGHSGTTVTELVHRHQLRPVLQTGATVMDQLLNQRDESA
jgi:hypothetical protein